jgi:hypothetical protein
MDGKMEGSYGIEWNCDLNLVLYGRKMCFEAC